jgi:DNA mismatch repair ATPase MutL
LLAVAGDRFALCEQDRDFNVMDLHAAIRAVVQARIARGERDARPLIIPETVNAALADERLDALGVLGVEFGRLSERSLVLRAVPVVVNEVDPAAFATALVAALGAGAEATDAIAASAATAFRAPRGIPERRRWFATLEQRLLELGLMSTEISVQLGLERLSALFESNHG